MNDPHKRNLPIPYFSQRENSFIWRETVPEFSEKEENGRTEIIKNSNVGDPVNGGYQIHMAGESCGITCLCMVLHYFGITPLNPYGLTERFYGQFFQWWLKDKYPDVDERTTYLHELKGELQKDLNNNPIIPVENLRSFAELAYDDGGMGVECEVYKNWKLDDVKESVAAGYPVIVNVGITHNSPTFKVIISSSGDSRFKTT